jgi:hypothetical protein
MGRFTRLARDEVNMNRKVAMGKVKIWSCALVLFGALVSLASAGLAQCTPVVYAFRHAEDTNPPNPPGPIFTLTPTGQAHAALYPTMVADFQGANNFCPVTKVYATTTVRKKDPCGTQCVSATNAFDTATPLAMAVMQGALPITTVDNDQLYEYLGNGNTPPTNPTYSTAIATALRTKLLETANRGESSAIFWTSQGLHVLGGVITNATSNVPDKNAGTTPPRNAVYIFEAVGSAGNIVKFSDTPLPPSVYVQCFNHVEASDQFPPPGPKFIAPTGSPPTQAYYCGYGSDQSNLGGKPGQSCPKDAQCGTIPNESNKDIKGKICNTITSMLPDTAGPNIFGACN